MTTDPSTMSTHDQARDPDAFRFPARILWGAATSAYRIDGAGTEPGVPRTELVLRGSTGDEGPALDAGLSGPALSHSSHA